MFEPTIILANSTFRTAEAAKNDMLRQSADSVPGRKTLFRARYTEDLKQALVRNNLVYSSYIPNDLAVAPAGTAPYSPFSISFTLTTGLYADDVSSTPYLFNEVTKGVKILVAYLMGAHNHQDIRVSTQDLAGVWSATTVPLNRDALAALRRGEQ